LNTIVDTFSICITAVSMKYIYLTIALLKDSLPATVNFPTWIKGEKRNSYTKESLASLCFGP